MRGYFGIGIYHPKNSVNIGTLWRSAYIYGADFIYTIGRRYKHQASDTLKTYRHIPLYNYTSFDDFFTSLPYGSKLVCIEIIEEATELLRFIHPQQAIYLLGAEDYGIHREVLGKAYATVRLPSPRDLCLNVSATGAIVLYDRYMKGAKNV